MAIAGKDWCDFVVWTLKQPASIQRIPFNLEFWNITVEKLNSFILKGIIPEIYTTRVLRAMTRMRNNVIVKLMTYGDISCNLWTQ